MKTYLAKEVFHDANFPLSVSLAPQRTSMPLHNHDFIELVLVTKGHTVHRVKDFDGKELAYGLMQGDLFSIMPGEMHSYAESRDLLLYNIAFKMDIIKPEAEELSQMSTFVALFTPGPSHFRNLHLSPTARDDAKRCLQAIMMEFANCGDAWKLRARMAFVNFLVIIDDSRKFDSLKLSKTDKTGLLNVLELIENDLKGKWPLAQLAKTAGMSVSQFTMKFRNMTGQSPIQYQLGIRLNHVCRMLADSDLSLTEIALRCGFCDNSQMIKAFRAKNGITPYRYRKAFCHRR